MDERLVDNLRLAYDRNAAERDARALAAWKIALRDAFAARLRAEGQHDLLEIGGGPGHFSAAFRDAGFAVVHTDLSPEMVRLARAKGLDARVMDFRHLAFPDTAFDGVFALNCLLHVPAASLPGVLAEVRRVLRPGGLFFYGVYGGHAFEGIWPDDRQEPKRHFTFYTDEALRQAVAPLFDEIDFTTVPLEGDEMHFQALTLRPKERA